ncbi:hypothetical protein ACFQE1_10645 [Halobium palmae]|uniref:Uncharacterized protein n=1 Tax=Halobium palmae TaxID=1776492 RepID=A0ABD5RZY1_9EURY
MSPTHSPSDPSEKRLAEWAAVIGGNVPETEGNGDPDGPDRAA